MGTHAGMFRTTQEPILKEVVPRDGIELAIRELIFLGFLL